MVRRQRRRRRYSGSRWEKRSKGAGWHLQLGVENGGSGVCADEDGGLIGGASLKALDFVEIMNAANQE